MVEIITGEKGKGKTKRLMELVEKDLEKCPGSLIFIDKDSKHMYSLDSKVRLINMEEFPLETSKEFLAFISGIISQNHDIQKIFLDSFLTIGFVDTTDGLTYCVDCLDELSERFETDFVLSVSKDKADLPQELYSKVIISL